VTARPGFEELQRQRAEAAGQGHLFAHWDELPPAGRARLLEAVARIDFERVAEFRSLLRAPSATPKGAIAAPELFPLARRQSEEAERARARGAELLAAGQVGYLLVAGGQASRLGYDGPKGAFEIGPLSGYTLFEYHARRLLAAQRRYAARTPWYVMTSEENDAATRACFEGNAYFGLDPEYVRFFPQAMVPAIDGEGRVLLSAPDRPFFAPSGHGGSLVSFASSGMLDHARSLGLRQLSYFQVDNPLARPADPLFLGLHDLAGAGMSSKVVAKREPAEKVGVLARIDGVLGCIEYSDLPEELRQARDADGQLTYRAGNIALHVLALDFLEELARGELRLPWHVARKEMQVHTPGGPAKVLGAKFETFVFDALGRSPASVTLEVERALEFSPVKNKSGVDSPASARRDLCRLHASWARAAGLELPAVRVGGEPAVEVDPCLAEAPEEFLGLGRPRPELVDGGHWYR
jgi:UDP-N-acetylglucosamine/UDP-N-acetylgalactosamine diphosphorylase